MSCGCDESPECQRSVTRKARKAYRCVECRSPIRPGEAYVYTSGIFDGSPFSDRKCVTCDEWQTALIRASREHQNGRQRSRIFGEAYEACWLVGAFWSEAIPEFTREVLGYDPRPARVAGALR